MTVIKSCIISGIFIYVAFCVCVYLKPEWFFYIPYNFSGNIKNVQEDGFDAKEVTYYKYNNIDVTGWLYLNKSKKNNNKVVLFLHGNAYNVEKYYHKLVPLADAGYSVFLPEYRGFGGQGKKIRQEYLTQDALNAVKYLNSIGFENKDIIVYGMSLGSHMALYTVVNAQENGDFEALVLEVPFTSLLDTVEFHTSFNGLKFLPLDLLLKDKYNNEDLIEKINTRLLVMTTKSDFLIPYNQALHLYEKAPEPKELKVYSGGSHDKLYNLRNYEKIIDWLEK